MKKYNIILSFFFLAFLFACSDDFLERKNPNYPNSGDYWTTEERLARGLSAAYRPLRFNGSYGRWLHMLYTARSDEGYSVSPNPQLVSLSNFNTYNDAGTEGVFYPWLDMYKGIFWVNQVLDNLPNVEDMEEETRNTMRGQALVLRGVHLFHIGTLFGRGPIILTSYAEDRGTMSEREGFYEQARLDFEEAKDLLPTYYASDSDLGRITKGAALGMLAKVYAQEKNWTMLEQTCQEIFSLKNASGGTLYQLVPNYADNFKSETENNTESIFELQVAYGEEDGIGLGHNRTKFMGLVVDDGAYDDSSASPIVKTDMEKEKTINGEVDPRLKETLFYYDTQNPSETFYGKTWTQWGLDVNRVYWKKYTNEYKNETEPWNNGINIRIVRLADIYLLYAEALNELGRTGDSYEYINYVRNRVNLPNLENSTVFTGIGNDQAKMRQQIMHERFCELASECWRWLDLQRWGYLDSPEGISYLRSRDSEFENYRIGISDRLPIPYREIPLVSGLEQNPGY